MKGLIIKISKWILAAATVALLVIMAFSLVLYLEWPWWSGLILLAGIVALFTGTLFIRKVLLRRREQRFVQEIIAQDQAYLERVQGGEKDHLKELQSRWKEAIKTLKKSHLRRFGNPLYVLPWYMVIGESGSGKTTAIKSARLSSPFVDTAKVAGISGTRNCDWWFFEHAVILDTAGRYAIPIEPGRDKDEWQRFMGLLAKYRKKEPINGLVVTVAADKLLSSSGDILERDGAEIRQRIDELMKVLGVRFPVYLLVTKCDLVQGMSEFCELLPESALSQAMGVRKEDEAEDPVDFAARAVDVTSERLKDLRLLLLGTSRDTRTLRGSLLFPEEFSGIKQGLEAFVRGAFSPNPYQESPLLKGIYFSSGRQEGSPYSHLLHSLGLLSQKDVLPGTNNGLFLHDFFAKILPFDRSSLAPTASSIRWQAVTRNLGLVSWVALITALCGLLSLSFLKNLWSLRAISREFLSPPAITGEFVGDLMTLDRFRAALVKVEQANSGWWIPRFGLYESQKVEERLKERYCSWVQKVVLEPMDQRIALDMAKFSKVTPENVLAAYLPYVIRRINLSRAYLNGKTLKDLEKMPSPGMIPGFNMSDVPEEEIQRHLDRLFLYYLAWNQDRDQVSRQLARLRSWLRHLFSNNGPDIKWIVYWINDHTTRGPVTLSRYWGGSDTGSSEPKVMPAFTKEGNDLRLSFLQELENALEDPLMIARQRQEFEAWYAKQYKSQWLAFAGEFSKGALRLKTREEWQQVAMRMTQPQNPYFDLISQLAVELEPVTGKSPNAQSSWIGTVIEIDQIRDQVTQEGALSKAKSALSAFSKKGKKVLDLIERSGNIKGAVGAEERLRALTAFKAYMKQLSLAAPIITSKNKAFKTARDIFSGGGENERNPVLAALGNVVKMKTAIGSQDRSDEIIWRLVQGPVDFIWSYACLEAACRLQEIWEQEILAEAQGPLDWMRLKKVLIGSGGKVWRFVKGPAAPFIGWQKGKGYYARQVIGAQLPFRAGFFVFLNKSAAGKVSLRESYDVFITALPTDVNVDATVKPHETRLELQCSDGKQVLLNLNYPVSKHFQWRPSSCGDVTLKVAIGQLVLMRQYTGGDGFPRFLKELRDGRLTLYPQDFPNQEAALKRMNIKFIRVQYKFKGNKPVIKLLKGTPNSIPDKIATCWD